MTNIDKLIKSFKNKNIIKTALTHRSYLNENSRVEESNERMEFLGDAILEFIISKSLYEKYPTKEEGYLTALRANLVNTTNLARVAKKLDLGSKLQMSKGEEESGGRENPTLMANTVEAVIGAVYLDQGTEAATTFIEKYLLVDLKIIASRPLKDAKSRLQEVIQSKGIMAPKYKVINEEGPDHNKRFTIEVVIDNKAIARGDGKSKNDAEQSAAKKALNKFKQLDNKRSPM